MSGLKPDNIFSIVIPTLNEESSIVLTLRSLENENFYEFILGKVFIVDDNSSDRTRELVNQFKTTTFDVDIIHRTRNKGYGASCLEGILKAFNQGFDKVLTMDADGSHRTSDITKLLDESKNFDGLIVGSRYVSGSEILGWPLSRRIMSKVANSFASAFLNITLRDKTNGFRVYQTSIRKLLEKQPMPRGYDFLLTSAFYWQNSAGNFREVPIYFENRKEGKSNLGVKQIFEWLRRLMLLRLEI